MGTSAGALEILGYFKIWNVWKKQVKWILQLCWKGTSVVAHTIILDLSWPVLNLCPNKPVLESKLNFAGVPEFLCCHLPHHRTIGEHALRATYKLIPWFAPSRKSMMQDHELLHESTWIQAGSLRCLHHTLPFLDSSCRSIFDVLNWFFHTE